MLQLKDTVDLSPSSIMHSTISHYQKCFVKWQQYLCIMLKTIAWDTYLHCTPIRRYRERCASSQRVRIQERLFFILGRLHYAFSSMVWSTQCMTTVYPSSSCPMILEVFTGSLFLEKQVKYLKSEHKSSKCNIAIIVCL